MTYHRVKEFQQISSSNRASDRDRDRDRVDDGVYAIALTGMLETVVTESERTVMETIDTITKQFETNQKNSSISNNGDQFCCSIENWCLRWNSEAELLAIISVPGIATLIQWASGQTKKQTLL
jgi:hypothetical protein